MGFTQICSEAVIEGRIRKSAAWAVISDLNRYPNIMENVDSVKILERSGNQGKSEWDITVEDAPISWVEKDKFDPDNFELEFSSIQGDFDNFDGRWSIQDNKGKGIKILFHVTYNLGIPVIEEVLGDILKEKMKNNIDAMMASVRASLKEEGQDERNWVRQRIGRFNNVNIGGKLVRAFIYDLSPKGLMAAYHPDFAHISGAIMLGAIPIAVQPVENDPILRRCRIMFAETLSPEHMADIVKWSESHNIRRYERKPVGREMVLRAKNHEILVDLIDISPEGLQFKFKNGFKKLGNEIRLGDRWVTIKHSHHNAKNNSTRVEFVEALEKEQVKAVFQSDES